MITGVLSGPGHSSPLKCVALSQKNACVASGDNNGTIIVHDMTKTGIVEFRADNVFAEVLGLCYLPNGSLVVCGWDDEFEGPNLKVFSPSLELVQTLEGHDFAVLCVTVSPSGSHIASGEVMGR